MLLNNYMNDSFSFETEAFTELLNLRSQTQQQQWI